MEPGQPVATIEAMKMEASITANLAGKVSKIAISKTQSVESGDLILIVSPN
ncbi:MAG: biotin/lipoyl-containing protein [Rhodoluna sp.]